MARNVTIAGMDSGGRMFSDFRGNDFGCSLSILSKANSNFKLKMFQILIREELGTLPKKPKLIKFMYCLCKGRRPVPNHQVALLPAISLFWFHHLPQDQGHHDHLHQSRGRGESAGKAHPLKVTHRHFSLLSAHQRSLRM